VIKVNRNAPPKGTSMDRKRKQELRKIKTEIDQGATSISFKNRELWREDRVKQFLHESQHGKCCYCEAKQRIKGGNVEHFRPKGRVGENKNHPGYWWLAYEWDNLLIACGTCNSKKWSKFPLMNEEDRVFNETDNLDKEKPYLINPLKENPERFIEFEIPAVVDWEKEKPETVNAIGKGQRGEKTVAELTGINDIEVKMERANKIRDYEMYLSALKEADATEEYRRYIDRCVSPEGEFSGFVKFYSEEKGYIPE